MGSNLKVMKYYSMAIKDCVINLVSSKKKLIRILIVLFILNMLDLIFTLVLLDLKIIEEKNIIMRYLMDKNILLAIGVKITIFLLFESILIFIYFKVRNYSKIYINKINFIISLAVLIIGVVYLFVILMHFNAIIVSI